VNRTRILILGSWRFCGGTHNVHTKTEHIGQYGQVAHMAWRMVVRVKLEQTPIGT
jgi:hypothetical protein